MIGACNGLGCSPSEYLRDLIAKDLRVENSQPKPAAATTPEPKKVVEGRWRLKPGEDPVYIPYADEIIRSDGTVHRYKNGKLYAYKKPGEIWTVLLT